MSVDWRWALAVGVIVCIGAPLWFVVFWCWFDFWRPRRTLAYAVFFATFVVVGAVVIALRRPIFASRFDPPLWLQIIGWIVMAAITVFGTVADRQIGVRVRSFMPFFDQRGHIDLETTGAYGVVRHPIYAAGVAFQLGTFLATGFAAVLVAGVIFTLGALWFSRQEEAKLMLLLDDPMEYERYRARVGGLFPRRAQLTCLSRPSQ